MAEQTPINHMPLKDYLQTHKHQVEMAAARATNEAQSLLSRAATKTNQTPEKIAATLRVTPERVIDVIEGNVNLNIPMLARYLNAMGYRLEINAVSLETGQPLPKPPRRAQRKPIDLNKKPSTNAMWAP